MNSFRTPYTHQCINKLKLCSLFIRSDTNAIHACVCLGRLVTHTAERCAALFIDFVDISSVLDYLCNEAALSKCMKDRKGFKRGEATQVNIRICFVSE